MERYNKIFEDDIRIPIKLYFNENKYTYNRVMSLQDVKKKMSKSDKSKKSCINLIDDPEMIRIKIQKAKTDSLGKVSAITNLINIFNLYR